MESEHTNNEGAASSLFKVTTLSKYLALGLFVALSFLGAWIGYTFAPEKVVEKEKVLYKVVQVDAENNYIDPKPETANGEQEANKYLTADYYWNIDQAVKLTDPDLIEKNLYIPLEFGAQTQNTSLQPDYLHNKVTYVPETNSIIQNHPEREIVQFVKFDRTKDIETNIENIVLYNASLNKGTRVWEESMVRNFCELKPIEPGEEMNEFGEDTVYVLVNTQPKDPAAQGGYAFCADRTQFRILNGSVVAFATRPVEPEWIRVGVGKIKVSDF